MNRVNWNENWKFWEEKDAFALVWNVPEQAAQVELPHDAMLLRTPCADSPNGGNTGFRDGGNYVYVKNLFAPVEYRQQTVALKFEGVYMNALVYVNGQLAGQRPYGYSQFIVPLNDYLHYGQDNEIRVLVKNNGMPNSRWYSGSGIYRDVWLLTGDSTYFCPEQLQVSTRWIEDGLAGLEVAMTVENKNCYPRSIRVVGEITAPDGGVAGRFEMPVALGSNTKETLSQTLSVENPSLWSDETPSLYRCSVTIVEDGVTLDGDDTSFGIRVIQVDARRGLRVNGQPVKLRGACIHHDNGPLGAVSCQEAEERRVRKLKEAGFNALRISHNPASVHLLDACDRLGVYVMDETFDMWTRPKMDNDYALGFEQWWREDVTALVRKDFNHPSVILYSLGNEIPEVGQLKGTQVCRDMSALVRNLDPTRLTTVSINGVFAAGDCVDKIVADVVSAAPGGAEGGNVNDFMSVMDTHMDDIVCHPIVSQRLENAGVGVDVLGYNYMAARYEKDAVDYPNRVLVGSETYPPDIARNWALVEKLPSVIGDFTWTGWDYIGEAGVGVPAYNFGEGGFGAQFPCQLAYCGDIDITGFRRPLSYFREIVYGLRHDPYIAVQNPEHYGEFLIKTPWVLSDAVSSWTYPGMEGKTVVVEVYAPGTQVELLCNGKSLGKAPAGSEAGYIARFETKYEPGELVAVAYDGDKELGCTRLVSAASASSIHLESQGTDLVYVDIALVDDKGCVNTSAQAEMTVSVIGGTLVGLCSGDPKPRHNYIESVTDTYNGRALAIVRPNGGEACAVTVTGNGLTGSLMISGK